MIVDSTLVLSDSQAVTATAASTNIINLGQPGTPYGAPAAVRQDIGIGSEIPIFISVTETFNNLTSITVSLQLDDNAAFSSPTTVATSAAIPLASLVAGYKFTWPSELPEGTNEQYLRLNYTVTGTAPTTGKLFAGIVGGRQTN